MTMHLPNTVSPERGPLSGPKRWLSRRGRRPNATTQSEAKQQGFDFAFTTSTPLGPRSPYPVTAEKTDNDGRPATSGGFLERRFSKKARIDAPPSRPRTADGRRPPLPFESNLAPAKSEANQIGLAFGSPTHAPKGFRDATDKITTEQSGHNIKGRRGNQEKGGTLQPVAWKKIGALIRSGTLRKQRESSNNHETSQLKEKFETAKSSESVFKLVRSKSRGGAPPIPPISQRSDPSTQLVDPLPVETEKPAQNNRPSSRMKRSVPILPDLNKGETPSETRPLPPRSTSLAPLQIKIPNLPPREDNKSLENDSGPVPPSSLLTRRSKTLDSLKSTHTSRNHSVSETEASFNLNYYMYGPESPANFSPSQPLPKPVAPFAEPTTSTTSSTPSHTPSPSTTSRYSLFPSASPSTLKTGSRPPMPEVALKRSLTSPARLSPMTDRFPKQKSSPLSNQREVTTASPEDRTASTEHSEDWSINHSLQSSVSSAATVEEIFFEIKSYRDSNGIEDGHFVMANPDPNAVQLARSRSRLNKSRSARRPPIAVELATAADNNRLSSDSPDEERSESRATIDTEDLDGIITAVDSLTSTMGDDINAPDMTIIPPPLEESYFSASSSSNASPIVLQPLRYKPPPRHERFNIDLPSPVIEEPTPTSIHSVFSNICKLPSPMVSPPSMATKQNKWSDLHLAESPTVTSIPSTMEPSLIVAEIDAPPPVPKKDSKFIPISKYAVRNTSLMLESGALSPVGRARSYTDTIPPSPKIWELPAEDVRRMSLERSRTYPALEIPRQDPPTAEIAELVGSPVPMSPAPTLSPTVSSTRLSTEMTTSLPEVILPEPAQTNQIARSNSRYTGNTIQTKSPLRTLGTAAAKNTLGDAGITTIAAIVRPQAAAEVTVARTVSISRQKSLKVQVATPVTITRRPVPPPPPPPAPPVVLSSFDNHSRAMSSVTEVTEIESDPGGIEVILSSPAATSDKEAIPSIQVNHILPDDNEDETEENKELAILERRSLVPIMVEGHIGHRPGSSMNIQLDSA